MKCLGIVVDNIKDAYSVIRELKRLRVPFVLLGPSDPVPGHVGALIECGSAADRLVGAVACGRDARSTVLKAMSLCRGEGEFHEVIVGIDPGKCTGIATIADGEVIETYTVDGSGIGAEVGKILEAYPASRFRFRIGTGRDLGRWLDNLMGDGRVEVEYVKETGMRLPASFSRKGLRKDAKSALAIALGGQKEWQ